MECMFGKRIGARLHTEYKGRVDNEPLGRSGIKSKESGKGHSGPSRKCETLLMTDPGKLWLRSYTSIVSPLCLTPKSLWAAWNSRMVGQLRNIVL